MKKKPIKFDMKPETFCKGFTKKRYNYCGGVVVKFVVLLSYWNIKWKKSNIKPNTYKCIHQYKFMFNTNTNTNTNTKNMIFFLTCECSFQSL